MKKTLLTLTAFLLALSLAGCSSSTTEEEPTTEETTEETADETVESKGTITVAASPTPHAEILEEAKSILAEEGWTLEITEFEDYVQPVEVVESGEIDCNYFAHKPYLDNYNEENGAKEVSLAAIHYEPFGIYPGTKASLDELEAGDEIVVPNDGTNETRALLLLQDNGIINLPEGTDASSLVTALDIESYNVDVKIVEVEAAAVSHYTDQAAVVVLNGNYALAAGLSVKNDAIAYESPDSSAATTYANVIAVTEGNENNEGVLALIDVLKSDAIKDFINETWDGSVIPAE